ncbi:MAG: hypothetical protein Q9162_002472 [Coniocarpon cinnabarinum]
MSDDNKDGPRTTINLMYLDRRDFEIAIPDACIAMAEVQVKRYVEHQAKRAQMVDMLDKFHHLQDVDDRDHGQGHLDDNLERFNKDKDEYAKKCKAVPHKLLNRVVKNTLKSAESVIEEETEKAKPGPPFGGTKLAQIVTKANPSKIGPLEATYEMEIDTNWSCYAFYGPDGKAFAGPFMVYVGDRFEHVFKEQKEPQQKMEEWWQGNQQFNPKAQLANGRPLMDKAWHRDNEIQR